MAGESVEQMYRDYVQANPETNSEAPTNYETLKAQHDSQKPTDPEAVKAFYGQNPSPLQPAPEQSGLMPAAPPSAPDNSAQFAPSPLDQQKPEQKKPSLDMQTADQLEKAYNVQGEAIKSMGDYSSLKAAATAQQYEDNAKAMAASQAHMQGQLAKVNQQVDDQIKQLDTYRQSLDGFNIKSPELKVNSPFTNGTTGQKIVAGIALALGAYGGALSGSGKNMAMDVLNNAIERDLEVQKQNIKNQQEQQSRGLQIKQIQMGASNNMLAAMQQKFGNTVQAESATRALMLETAKARLEAISNKYNSPEILAKTQALGAELDRQKTEELYKFKSAAENKELLNTIGAQMGNNGEMPKLTPAQEAALPKEMREALEKRRERFVPGYGEAVNKEQANEFQKFVAETGPALTNARQVMELGKKMTLSKSLSPEARAEMESKLAILAGQLRLPITGPGALTADEYKRLRETLGDPSKIVSLKAAELKKLQTVINFLQSSVDERAKNAGLRSTQQLGKPVQ